MTHRTTASLLDHEVLLVTGKGGVGKSTVAAVTARAAAQRGKNVLLVEYESVSRAAPLFGRQELGTKPVQVDDRLWLRGFETTDSLEFFMLQQLKMRSVVKLVMRNKTVLGFFMAMPAIKSVTFLYHLWRLVEDHGPRGDGKFDLVVCDLPTTGFIMGLYGVPKMVQQIFHIGPLARVANGMGDFLYDTRRTGLVLVTLPEEMPVVETVEFLDALQDRYGVHPAATIVNGVYPQLFGGDELAALDTSIDRSHASDDVIGLLDAALLLEGRHERARRLRPMLEGSLDCPTYELPHLFARQLPLAAVDKLATALNAAVSSAREPA